MTEQDLFDRQTSTGNDLPGIPIKTFIAFVILSLGFIFAGYRYYLSERERYSADKWNELSAIARLKESQVDSWRRERLSDANFVFHNDFIPKAALAALRVSDPRFDYGSSSEWMRSMYKNMNYETIALFDRLHKQRLAVPGGDLRVTPYLDSLFSLAASRQHIIFSDIYRDADNRPTLSLVIPLLVGSGTQTDCAGLALLQIDPQTTLFPFIQSWPIPSSTGEMVLVRREVDSVVVLNSLRFTGNVGSWIRVPLNDTARISARIFRRGTGRVQGIDYRGKEAFAVAHPIDATDWVIVAKYDASEVFAPLSQTRYLLLIVVIMLVLTGGVSIMFVWRHRRALYYRREYERELERRHSAAVLRESEERFRMLVESLNEIVYTLDTENRFLGVYGSWVERFGVDAESVRGKSPEEIFGSESADVRREMSARALKGEHVLYESTYIDSSTGEAHDVQTSLSPLRGSSGRIIGIVGVGRDITKMKHLERDLIQSQKMDSLGKLAGGIAHDFNNLLAMLMGSAELLNRNLKDDAANMVHVQRIIEATERGASIAKRLLLFSRQDASEFQPVSVAHILTEVSEMLRHSFPKTISVVLDVQAEDAIINGDPGQLHQAFVNLCINAKDAMGDEGTLTLTERTADARGLADKYPDLGPGRAVTVSITDTGAGIDPAHARRIFEPFFTTKEKGKGTGLGLSIVDGIIANHHGHIDVQSERGKGTTFTLYFPCYEGPPAEEKQMPAEEKGTGERILIVDDEQLIREMLGEYLMESGYSVLIAEDAEEALDLYKTAAGTIDVVITDLGMPKMSGEQLFVRIREIDPSASVIISSGYLDGTTRSGLLAKGVVGVLTKPYRLNEIQTMVGECLKHRRRRT